MTQFRMFGFLILMGFDTLAQLSFKKAAIEADSVGIGFEWLGQIFGAPWIYGAFVGYIGAFFCWITLLKHLPVGPAFAATHLEIISVMLMSAWLFDEHISALQILAAILILAGVACLAVSEQREARSTTQAD